MLAAIEMHNKPTMAYRYEVCTLLVINAWELVLKSILYKTSRKQLYDADGHTISFRKCLNCVASLASGDAHRDFLPIKASLEHLYDYRNKVAHFHSEALDGVLFSLLQVNILFFVRFVREQCGHEVCKGPLMLLPLSLSGEFHPVEFLINRPGAINASREVREFLNGLVESCQRLQDAGVEDAIFST